MNFSDITKQVATPLYLFDGKILRERISHIRKRLPHEAQICYAVKANTFILRELKDEQMKFEVCSPGELSICKELDIDPQKLVISGVYKTPKIIEELFADTVFPSRLTVESASQFELIKSLAEKYQRPVKLLLRLTSGNQFGIDKSCVLEIIATCKNSSLLEVSGLQYYSGTQKTSAKRIAREIKMLDDMIGRIKEECGFEIGELEYGTGFPVSYFEGENCDEDELCKSFCTAVGNMENKVRLTVELGRFIAAQCGFYLTKVVDIKQNKGADYAIVDGGINHLTYFGQSMAMKKPFVDVYPHRNPDEGTSFNVCGSLCTANDILIKQLDIPLQVGDLLVFKNAGAYCATEGISLFLSRRLPTVILKTSQDTLLCLRKDEETYKLNY